MFNLIVAGDLEFNSMSLLTSKLDTLLSEQSDEIAIISGGARGADTLGEEYAKLKSLHVYRVLPLWDAFGKSAGPKRNTAMAEIAHAVVVFHAGTDRGSQSMIRIATERKLPLRVISY